MKFLQIILLGSGTIAISVLQSLRKREISPLVVICKDKCNALCFAFIENYAHRFGLETKIFLSNRETDDFFKNIDKSTLVISANNTYLFPKAVLENSNLKIINFHNALLPHHKGMNAPTWSIYEQDKVSGITWHVVNEQIDSGEIIVQKSVIISEDETAISLVKKLMQLGIVAFDECLDSILTWNFIPSKSLSNKESIHRAKDIPNNGVYEDEWCFEKKSSFLRSLDWGGIRQFPLPIVHDVDGDYQIEDYRIDGNNIWIKKKKTSS